MTGSARAGALLVAILALSAVILAALAFLCES